MRGRICLQGRNNQNKPAIIPGTKLHILRCILFALSPSISLNYGLQVLFCRPFSLTGGGYCKLPLGLIPVPCLFRTVLSKTACCSLKMRRFDFTNCDIYLGTSNFQTRSGKLSLIISSLREGLKQPSRIIAISYL